MDWRTARTQNAFLDPTRHNKWWRFYLRCLGIDRALITAKKPNFREIGSKIANAEILAQ